MKIVKNQSTLITLKKKRMPELLFKNHISAGGFWEFCRFQPLKIPIDNPCKNPIKPIHTYSYTK